MALIDDLIAGNDVPVQDYVLLNGTQSPGRAIVKGAALKSKWDNRDGYGSVGASVWYIGEKLSEFSVEFALWLPEHFGAWNSFARQFFSRGPQNSLKQQILGSGGTLFVNVPKSFKISHPLLNIAPLNINEAVVTDVGQFSVDDFGLYTCEVKFLEYKPRPQIAAAKPDPIPDTDKPVTPPAKTKGEMQIEALAKQVAAERAKL